MILPLLSVGTLYYTVRCSHGSISITANAPITATYAKAPIANSGKFLGRKAKSMIVEPKFVLGLKVTALFEDGKSIVWLFDKSTSLHRNGEYPTTHGLKATLKVSGN